MFWLFRGKKEVERIEEEAKKGFESVKKDIMSIGGWIKHLESEKNIQKKEIEDQKESLSSVYSEIEGLKNVLSLVGDVKIQQPLQSINKLSNKQTAVGGVQIGVQTGVQTLKLSQFSITERAILWILLNEDRKLSYEDLAAMLGKEKSTIRGQLNNIKSKNEGLILEEIEKNGKKRLYVLEEMKEKMLKKQKVRVKNVGKIEKY